MSRSLLIGVAAFAAVALVPAVPAAAQDITVTQPKAPRTGQPKTGVHPERQLVARVTVFHDDLDLRSDYGRYVLNQRVRAAANEVCDRIDRIDSPIGLSGPVTESQDCRTRALTMAQAQARNAVWRAG